MKRVWPNFKDINSGVFVLLRKRKTFLYTTPVSPQDTIAQSSLSDTKKS